ncbi:hypothetical protein V2J09_022801 [Rumex salicifolius]
MSVDDHSIVLQKGEGYHPTPVKGMEFESYSDAYNYYNSYAKELGFAIRVKSSWTKHNSKEKSGAVLCCNCEGFKTTKESTTRRKETRTGCLAMIRLRLAESNVWRVDEAKLEHNHSFDPERALNSKLHKKIEVEAKRNLEPFLDVEVRTIKLYYTPFSDLVGTTSGIDIQSKCLKLKEDGFEAQLRNPDFMYLMDLNDEGQLKNESSKDSNLFDDQTEESSLNQIDILFHAVTDGMIGIKSVKSLQSDISRGHLAQSKRLFQSAKKSVCRYSFSGINKEFKDEDLFVLSVLVSLQWYIPQLHWTEFDQPSSNKFLLGTIIFKFYFLFITLDTCVIFLYLHILFSLIFCGL